MLYSAKKFFSTLRSDPLNTDAKTILWGTIRGSMLPQKTLKTRCLRLAKNAFAIQHLLHSIV